MRRGDAGVALFWLVLGAAVCAHALRLGVFGNFFPQQYCLRLELS